MFAAECASGDAVLDKVMFGTKDAAQCFNVAIPIPKKVQSNSVLKLFGARNVLLHGRIKRAFGFLQTVKMTR